MSLKKPHIPVLVKPILEHFEKGPLCTFIDGTLGAGGHAEALLEAHPEIETYYGIDQDERALERAEKRLAPFAQKMRYVHGNFRDLAELCPQADGILLDVGVSSMQLDEGERGFSFSKEGPLDMRMDRSRAKTAADVVNRYPERELARIFFEYGEERRSRRAAQAIVEARKRKRIETTQDLERVLARELPRFGKIHPMTRVFQALRIEVNEELLALEEGVRAALSHLHVGGRLGVISFHSLEDRIVKHLFRDATEALVLTKKPIVATREEVRENPRSRSAKLRFVERVNG